MKKLHIYIIFILFYTFGNAQLDKNAITGNNKFDKSDADAMIDAINANYNAINAGVTPNTAQLLQLPSKIYAVQGDVLQLFYRGMLKWISPEQFHFRVDIKHQTNSTIVGDLYERYIEFIPTETGNYDLTVELMDFNGNVVSTAQSVIEVKAAVNNPSSIIQMISIGDSLTSAGIWDAEALRRLTATDGTPTGNGFTNFANVTEGASGKNWVWFVTDTSPFWNATLGRLDFQNYVAVNSLPSLDAVNILLTWNMGYKTLTQAEWDAWDDNVYTFIDQLHSDFPNCKINLISPPAPPVKGSLGELGANGDYLSDVYTSILNSFGRATVYERIANEANYSSFVTHVQSSITFDSDYGYPITTKTVNSRHTQTEFFMTGGIHPSNFGYYQIGDASYRLSIHQFCQ